MQELHPVAYQILALLKEGGCPSPDVHGALELLQLELQLCPPRQRAFVVESALMLACWLAEERSSPEIAARIIRIVMPDLSAESPPAPSKNGDGFERGVHSPRPSRVGSAGPFASGPRPGPIVRNEVIQRAILAERFRIQAPRKN